MKILAVMSGASGAVYFDRFLEKMPEGPEVHITATDVGKQILDEEMGKTPGDYGYPVYGTGDFTSVFASGSALWSGVVFIPCSMGMLGRIASGVSENLLTRAADVALKEKRELITVVRETPVSLVHIENMKKIVTAGGTVMPAAPSFYKNPEDVVDLVDTVVSRVYDHLDIEHTLGERWNE